MSLSKTNFYLGIDAGGTKTQAVVTNQDSSINTEYITGSGNYKVVGLQQAIQNIKEATQNAIQNLQNKLKTTIEIESACIGMASLDTPHDREILTEAIQKAFRTLPIEKCKLVNDTKIALRSGTKNPNAIVLIAGTGSHCYGTNQKGVEVNIGGLDYMISDEGSGYMLGSRAIHAAVQSMDGRIEKSLLENLVTKNLNIQSMRDAKDVVVLPEFSKTKIASFAAVVFKAAARSDTAALKIIDQTVEEDIQLISAAIKRLEYTEKFDLVFVGGLFKENIFKTKIIEQIKQKKILANVIFPELEPVWGAIQIAQS
jgi:N-acetylglucosamine kinase-like BadF-type ATPase